MLDLLTERLGKVRTTASRITLVPALVRVGAAGCALAALVVAYPAALLATRVTGLLVLAALWPAVAARGRGATVVALLAVAGWIADTTWYGQPPTLGRLVALATLLYLLHSLTALAAVLPYDALVRVDVVALWLARAFAVVLASAVLTGLVWGITGQGGRGTVVAAAVVGFAAAVGLAGLLAWLLRRPA